MVTARASRFYPPADQPSGSRLRNELLRCPPERDLKPLWQHLEPVELKPRRVLRYPNTAMDHVYFVEEGLISVLAHTSHSKSVEVWLIGREGLVGVPAVLGERVSSHRRIVQVAGSALRIHADDLRRVLDESAPLRHLLPRYVQTVLIQTSQLGACNAHHGIQQRLARWLLMLQDRCQTAALPLTHEMVSCMLGVRRATVSDSIAALEEQGILGGSRSLITIVDRRELELIACVCYRIVKSADKRLTAYREITRTGSRRHR